MKLPEPYRFTGKGIGLSHIAVYGIRSINDDKTISQMISDPSRVQVWFLVCISGTVIRRAKINKDSGVIFRPRRERWRRNILTDGKVFYNVVYGPGKDTKFIASRCQTRANYMNEGNRREVVDSINRWLSNNT